MTPAVVAVTAAAGALVMWPARDARARLRRTLAHPASATPTSRLHRARWAVVAGGAAALSLGGPALVLVTLALAGARAAARRGRPVEVAADLPLVADLVASCLAAGASVADAMAAAAAAAAPATGARCRAVADRLRAGAPPVEAWSECLGDPGWAPVARACVRGASTGVATSAEIHRAAARVRGRRAAEANRRAQRAAVLVVLPLGLCFLPAFVLVGVVPFALGLLPH